MPRSGFIEAAQSWGAKQAYVAHADGLSTASTIHPTKDRILESSDTVEAEEWMAELRAAGFAVLQGHWKDSETEATHGISSDWPHVAAVSYVSGEASPGLWLDASLVRPAEGEVLKRLYEDFMSTGELAEISLEEFIRLAKPTVVIASPDELRSYLKSDE